MMSRESPEAVIVRAEIVAGHDGTAELLVTLAYSNGATGAISLDQQTGLDLLAACGASGMNELIGQPWRRIVEGAGR
jgi:hypothetical protein